MLTTIVTGNTVTQGIKKIFVIIAKFLNAYMKLLVNITQSRYTIRKSKRCMDIPF